MEKNTKTVIVLIAVLVGLFILWGAIQLQQHITFTSTTSALEQLKQKYIDNHTYYYDIDYVDDFVVCVILVTELGDEVAYLDTRFGTYPQSVRDSFEKVIETQCGQSSIYAASLRYNTLIDAWLQEYRQSQLKLQYYGKCFD